MGLLAWLMVRVMGQSSGDRKDYSATLTKEREDHSKEVKDLEERHAKQIDDLRTQVARLTDRVDELQQQVEAERTRRHEAEDMAMHYRRIAGVQE